LYGVAAALVAVGLASLLWNSRALGIYAVAFVAGAYVVVRHLAHVELWDSGAAIVQGLSRPARKVLAVIVYPPLDFFILTAGVVVAAYTGHWSAPEGAFKTCLLEEGPVWVGIPFLALYAGKTYRRVWSRARVSEYVLLAAVAVGGIVVSAGVIELMGRTQTHEILVHALVLGGVALPGIIGIRAFPRAVQDAMGFVRRRERGPGDPSVRHVLMYGAGYRCTLCLRERTFGPVAEQAKCRVIGILDDDPNLHGRFVHGHLVMGGMEIVTPELLRTRRVDQVVVTASLEGPARERLLEAAAEAGAGVVEWRTEFVPMAAGAPSEPQRASGTGDESRPTWVGPRY
jgi:FlaA1/EpsC-like NDP-sugar epimerase